MSPAHRAAFGAGADADTGEGAGSSRTDVVAGREVLRWGVVTALLCLLPGLLLAVFRPGVVSGPSGSPTVTGLVANAGGWFFWLLAAPAVILLSTRFPLEGGTRPIRLPLHAAAAVGFAVLHTLFAASVRRLAEPELYAAPLGTLFRAGFPSIAMIDLLVYAAATAVVHAFVFQRRTAERVAATARLRSQLTGTRLQALRLQLNPHFVFNALNSVSMLIRREQGDRAVRALSDLSLLLRDVLAADEEEMVPFDREMELLERYVAVERLRFGERLEYDTVVEPAAREAMVPRLLLQPLVENAIRHGVGASPEGGRVVVRARRGEGRLHVTVEDDGPGLEALPDEGPGVGIANTRDRLEAHYGERYDLRAEPREDGGTRVVVVLPDEPSVASRVASVE